MKKYQVTPLQIIELKALMGDASDNIPGVPKIGEKTATKIISEYGSIENAYAHVDEIKPNQAQKNLKEHYDMAQLSKTLATINTDCGVEFIPEEMKLENMYTKEAFQILKDLEFKSFLGRFSTEAEKECGIEEKFVLVEDFAKAESILEDAKKEDHVLSLIHI